MALLPDLDDIPFLNPEYDEIMSEVEEVVEDDMFIGMEQGSGDDGLEGSSEAEGVPLLGQGEVMTPMPGKKRRPEDPMDGWFPGSDKAAEYKDLFESLECRKHFVQAKPGRTEEVPKDCEKLLYSISFLTFQVFIALKRSTCIEIMH